AMKHKTEKPINPRTLNPQIPEELSALILKCMEKDRNKRYQKTQELLSDLRVIRKSLPTTEIRAAKRKPVTSKEITVTFSLKKMFFPALVLLSLAAVTVIVWLFRSPPSISAVPDDKSSIAVMYFRNNTGDAELEHWRSALTDLLITDLSQSKYVRVLSAERMYNILQELNQLEATTYSTDVIREVAQRGAIHYVLVGGYTRAEDSYRVTCSLLEAQTGELLASESVSGEGEASFYNMVDELTRRIKLRLNISGERLAMDQDREVEDITSSSPEALKLYSEGRKLHLAGDYIGSLSEMQKVLEIDAEFAMAHRSVAMSYNNLGYLPAKKTALTKAFELRDRVSDRERYLIEGDYYRAFDKDQDKAIESFEKLLQNYPNDSTAIANLAGLYSEIEAFDKALEYNQRNYNAGNINLITIYNLADNYLSVGRPDKTIELVSSHLQKNPEYTRLHNVLILAYVAQGKYDRALMELNKLSKSVEEGTDDLSSFRGDIYLLKGDLSRAEQEYLKYPEENRTRRISLSILHLTKGKFRDAAAQLEKKPELNEALGFVYPKAGRYAEGIKVYESEIADSLRGEKISDHIYFLHMKGLALLAQNEDRRAEETASELRALIQRTMNQGAIRFYHHLTGRIQLHRGEVGKAIKSFEKAVSLLPHASDLRRHLHPMFYESLAAAYEQKGDLEKAKKTYTAIIGLNLERLRDGDIYALSFYRLGKILQEQGHTFEASENYQKFLDLWKGADPDRPELEDARTRLSRLLSF
ncbi:MAG: tetratricopeptide repeat protein, partial [Candidatus Aminicenantes bacterium]|nr:tetratricopeptide repeat protein [Candidatus Aminicenantes bacterium]